MGGLLEQSDFIFERGVSVEPLFLDSSNMGGDNIDEGGVGWIVVGK